MVMVDSKHGDHMACMLYGVYIYICVCVCVCVCVCMYIWHNAGLGDLMPDISYMFEIINIIKVLRSPKTPTGSSAGASVSWSLAC